MGHRANLVVKRAGKWRLFYDHWCANRLDVELFWGPELATGFIHQLQPVSDQDWLDEVWAEGGAIVDADARVLVWFGGSFDVTHDVPRRRALLELMRPQWRGWEVRWANGAIAELGAYLRLPIERFLVEDRTSFAFTVLTEFPDDNETLVTVRENGRTLVTRVYGDLAGLEAGSAQLSTLLQVPRAASLTWTNAMPTAGVHVDVDGKSLHYWLAVPACGVEQRVRRAWTGWRTEWLRDNFETHLNLANVDCQLPLRPAAELRAGILEYLRECCTHAASNPAAEVAELLGATEVNPDTAAGRGSIGSEEEKLQLLDRLAAIES